MKVIHVLRRPLSEKTVAANTLWHGCGGLNINASRVAAPGEVITTHTQKTGEDGYASNAVYGDYEGGFTTHQTEGQKLGRWPGNLILQHLEDCRCEGTKQVCPSNGSGIAFGRNASRGNVYAEGKGLFSQEKGEETLTYLGSDGSETVANWVCAEGCPAASLDQQSGVLKSGAMDSVATGGQYTTYGKMYERRVVNPASEGGASRFFKQVGGG